MIQQYRTPRGENLHFTPPHLRKFNLLALLVLLLLAACTKDDGPADGEYPLQIASVTLDVEGTAQPWTRITETPDGSGSTWTGGERIGVRIGNDGTPGTYTVNADGTVSPVTPAYWQSTAPATITAWYPVEETVSLADQTGGLAYVLRATVENAPYGQPVRLNFTHQLAKVRVVLGGTQAAQVSQVEVNNFTQCFNDQGLWAIYTEHRGWIKMRQVDATTWEANVISGLGIDPANFIRLNGSAMATNLTSLPSMLVAGQMYTVSLTVGEPVLQDGATLTEPGTYTMQGTYTQGITIQGDDITVVMDGATVSTSGIGINVQSDATIQVQGAGNTITSGSAGIYVAEGSTVAIEGSGRDDQLTARGGNGGAGIGGYLSSPNNGVPCGNITIRNVTVYSYGSNNSAGDRAAGIGGASGASCGAIAIENATVHAYGAGSPNQATPAIGSGYPVAGDPASIPKVTITGQSEVHAHRGGSVGNTDYIGWGSMSGNHTAANAVNLGGGTCTNSTVYCYTGTGNTPDKTLDYDASGTGTERP